MVCSLVEEELRNSRRRFPTTGQPVYIGDSPMWERRYQDPTRSRASHGENGVLLSVEMQKGNNIVSWAGRSCRACTVRPLLPPDLKLGPDRDQPSVVSDRIKDLEREFLLASGRFILVTISFFRFVLQ